MPEPGQDRRPIAVLTGCVRLALDWFYPRHCYHCGEPLNDAPAQMLCETCNEDLSARRITGCVCAVCGLPLAGEPAPETVCMMCRGEERHFDAARAFFTYASPVPSIIRHFKFEGDYFLGPMLLRDALERGWLPTDVEEVDAVVAVPLHTKRRRERGYDQALLLARVIAAQLDCELVRRTLVRTRYTTQQSLLPTTKRWDNVRRAFAVRKPKNIRDRRLLLVDDVMTTGNTADACASALKTAGARQVKVLTLARTTP